MMFFLALCVTCATVAGLWALVSRTKSKLPYPPGPKGLLFIGNALDIDPQRPHRTFAQWGKIHGLWTNAYLCSKLTRLSLLWRGHRLSSYPWARCYHPELRKDFADSGRWTVCNIFWSLPFTSIQGVS
ncbi:hypothetical protein EV401DRAFT_1263481 [Pisolithus croceorrhizus]|nr:hypothetical protein EV401DRAFT_1263481 [Pisolithus croceorrhizus]